MKRRKTLKELTIKDSFMFGAVMVDEENCKGFLELALDFPIERVTVSKEKSIVYHPEYKGVRLDVIARDERQTRYNVEMQVTEKPALGKRTRYYHSQLDMEILETGKDYRQLPDTYVIFICDYDPFGARKYRYTWETICREKPTISLQEGRHTIIFSTCGENDEEVPGELVKFLKYVGAGLEESIEDYKDAYVQKLQTSVKNIKTSREMEAKYMLLLKEWIEEEREDARAEALEEGRAEGRAEAGIDMFLEVLFNLYDHIPTELEQILRQETDPEILKGYIRKAMKASSIEEFQEMIRKD